MLSDEIKFFLMETFFIQTAIKGLVKGETFVRLIIREVSGKMCWDASPLLSAGIDHSAGQYWVGLWCEWSERVKDKHSVNDVLTVYCISSNGRLVCLVGWVKPQGSLNRRFITITGL